MQATEVNKRKVMATLENAARQALEALECHADIGIKADKAIYALREALEQAEQEPVAKVQVKTTGGNAGLATQIVEIDDPLRERLQPGQLLYTEPPMREWVGLTVADIKQGFQESWVTEQAWQSAVWWAEQKLKELNT